MQLIQKCIVSIQSYQNTVREWLKWLWLPPHERKFFSSTKLLHKNLGLEKAPEKWSRVKKKYLRTELSFLHVWRSQKSNKKLAEATGRTPGGIRKKLSGLGVRLLDG